MGCPADGNLAVTIDDNVTILKEGIASEQTHEHGYRVELSSF